MEYVGFDCHKHYTYAVVKDERGHGGVRNSVSHFVAWGTFLRTTG